ncbi:MAG: glycoside hydrolase 5 family protein [Eubacteriales bacterium]|jgi:hypothetical protein
MPKLFDEPFFIGCNYWASHAGTNMWRDWREEVVEADLTRLRDMKQTVLRVFPLWPDFQPLTAMYTGGGRLQELRMGEDPLPDTPAGRAGIDEVMLERFETFCDLASDRGLRLIVGLITGWMSGRLYVPRAFEGRGVLTDPLALTWEIRYVKHMVARFKDHPAIAAWDLGNECNCMEPLDDPYKAELWTALISDAIRTADPEGTASGIRPIVSGMHGINPEGVWKPRPHTENVDILTTHPYPIFTPYCDTDPIGSFKSSLHAAAQSVWYRGMGGKPCFVEEIGTLGPMLGDERTAADYINAALYQTWAHDCRGFLWWCANEQSHLTHAPYDWHAVERELGLFRLDGTPKPVAETMAAFSKNIWHIGKLPERIVDAVCVTTAGQDCWSAAYGTFLLAKQAGMDIEYCDGAYPLPDARTYLLPSLCGGGSMSGRAWRALLDRVRNGANLYLSLDTALVSPFEEFTGLRIRGRARSGEPVSIAREKLTVSPSYHLTAECVTAKALLSEPDGNPVLTVNEYGAGRVYTLLLPIERVAAQEPGIITSQPLYRVYEAMGLWDPTRVASRDDAGLCMTEHPQDERTRILTLINPGFETRRNVVRLSGVWRLGELLGDPGTAAVKAVSDGFSVTLQPCCAVVVSIRR